MWRAFILAAIFLGCSSSSSSAPASDSGQAATDTGACAQGGDLCSSSLPCCDGSGCIGFGTQFRCAAKVDAGSD